MSNNKNRYGYVISPPSSTSSSLSSREYGAPHSPPRRSPPSSTHPSSSHSSSAQYSPNSKNATSKQQQPTQQQKSQKNQTTSTTTKPKTNRLFLTFAILTFAVSIINIQFHHIFHDEHVLEKSRRQFQKHLRTSRHEVPLMDDYVRRRTEDEDESEEGGIDSSAGDTNKQQSQNVGAAAAPGAAGGGQHKLAGLKCQEKYGGPDDEYAEKEMAFWSDIPSDATYKSPFMDVKQERFLTFEPDHGGWNNIRMAMETALVMSHAMGRTLVLPPEQRFYLLGKSDHKQKNDFDFGDFFHLDSIAVEHEGFNVISSEEFLHRYGKNGKLMNVKTGKPEVWNEKSEHTSYSVKAYFRKIGVNPLWNPMDCIAAFPAAKGPEAIDHLRKAHKDMFAEVGGRKKPSLEEFEGKPIDVDAPLEERMRELLADRSEICVYDTRLQEAHVLHFPAEKGTRLLTHFYAFIFFADWRADLWSKRFVRDHLRYIDEIMCAAARVVEAVRKRSKNKDGLFDSMHIRRGDFQYKKTRLEAKELIKKSKDKLEQGGLLYIATDERDKSFFKPFKDHYDVVFLDDFKEHIKGINTNFYGMLDQLIASKGRIFFGTWWSTLSGYVNRMRGYYIAKHKLEGYQDGSMESYYFYPDERKNQMKTYMPVKKPIYMREFPTSWRDIDKGIEELQQ